MGLNIKKGINRYCKTQWLDYETDLEFSVFSEKKRAKTLKRIVSQVKKNRPVILSIGPKVLGKVDESKKVLAYQKGDSTLISFSKAKYYNKEEEKYEDLTIADHYITVTGVVINKQTDTIKLQISSWGEKYYIDFGEICKYVDFYKNSWTCDAVYVSN